MNVEIYMVQGWYPDFLDPEFSPYYDYIVAYIPELNLWFEPTYNDPNKLESISWTKHPLKLVSNDWQITKIGEL